MTSRKSGQLDFILVHLKNHSDVITIHLCITELLLPIHYFLSLILGCRHYQFSSFFSGCNGFSCVLLSLGIVHAGIDRAYFISSHIMSINWSKSSDFRCQEPDCTETHTYLHPYSLNSLHHSIYLLFIHQLRVWSLQRSCHFILPVIKNAFYSVELYYWRISVYLDALD